MDAAVDAVLAAQSRDRKETGPVPHRMSEAQHRAGTVRLSAEGLACTKAICNYIHDAYGRFPGGIDAMHLMWVMQAHHIDTDYYDRFFGPGAYGLESPRRGANRIRHVVGIGPPRVLIEQPGELHFAEPGQRQVKAVELQLAQLGVVELLDGPGPTLPWRYHPGFLRRWHRRRRACPWAKRARFANAIPDVVDTQEPGHHRSLGPSTRRRPERHLCAAQQKRFGEPPRRATNRRLHHRHTGKVIIKKYPAVAAANLPNSSNAGRWSTRSSAGHASLGDPSLSEAGVVITMRCYLSSGSSGWAGSSASRANAVGGHRLGLPPLRVSRGPDRSSHWKIRPLRSATIIALCIGCTYPPGDWDGVRKNEVTGSNRSSKMVARYWEDLLAAHIASKATKA